MKSIRHRLLILTALAIISSGCVPGMSAAVNAQGSAKMSAPAQNVQRASEQRSATLTSLSGLTRVTAIASSEKQTRETIEKETARETSLRKAGVRLIAGITQKASLRKQFFALKAHLPRLTLPVHRSIIMQYIHAQDGLK